MYTQSFGNCSNIRHTAVIKDTVNMDAYKYVYIQEFGFGSNIRHPAVIRDAVIRDTYTNLCTHNRLVIDKT